MSRQLDNLSFWDEWLRDDASGAAYYRAIRPAIAASLVSERSYERILEVASQVPGNCAMGGFYFELGLETAEAEADIAFRALPAHGCPAALAVCRPVARRSDADPWRLVQRLASKWDRPGEFLQEAAAELWLEFDIQGSRPEVPSFFLTPASSLHSATVALLQYLQAEVGGRRFLPATCSAAQSLVEHLPEQFSVTQIGFMSSRRPHALRLCLSCREWEVIQNYLLATDVGFDRQRINEVLPPLVKSADYFMLHLDFTEALHPKIGLDLLLNQTNPRLEPRWGRLFATLRAMQLCTPAKQDALLDIYGYTAIGDNFSQWPPALRQRFFASNFTELSCLVRAISHLKVVIEPDQDLCAKAYLSVNHCWSRK